MVLNCRHVLGFVANNVPERAYEAVEARKEGAIFFTESRGCSRTCTLHHPTAGLVEAGTSSLVVRPFLVGGPRCRQQVRAVA